LTILRAMALSRANENSYGSALIKSLVVTARRLRVMLESTDLGKAGVHLHHDVAIDPEVAHDADSYKRNQRVRNVKTWHVSTQRFPRHTYLCLYPSQRRLGTSIAKSESASASSN
jgi:hypothetical protein